MSLDALAFEGQFLDHIAPLWTSLPPGRRGRFLADESLVTRAARAGIEADGLCGDRIRSSSPPPNASLEDGPIALAASIGDIKIGRRLGYRRFVFLEHGAGQSYGGDPLDSRHTSYAGGPDREDVILNLVPNETCAERWRTAYPDTPTVVIGCPKLDSLPTREPGPKPVVALSFHWPASVSISGYAGNALSDFVFAFDSIVQRFSVIGHAHPKGTWPELMSSIYKTHGIPFVPDFEDVCRQADVYVCDNSSTIFEFAATGRPVVVLNARHWHRGPELGLRFWAASHVGINVSSRERLVGAIAEALEDRSELQAARRDALEIVYQPSTTGAAKRGAEAIMQLVHPGAAAHAAA